VRSLATETIAPAAEERVYFRQAFAWMGAALAITGVVAYALGRNAHALHAFLTAGGGWLFGALLIVEFLLVGGLVTLVSRMDLFETAAIFLGYAALNGLTFSVIFAAFTTKSIFSTFLVTAAMFGALALWGYTTNADLTSWGSFLFMALVGQIVGVFVNLFWLNETLYWLTTATGVVIFSAYTAYDVQKLKRYEPPPGSDVEVVQKDAIVGALALYLDFVNLFLYLLRLFGRRR
jgi:FtsH-binding integral membrane protein